jgi:hypothetical protein
MIASTRSIILLTMLFIAEQVIAQDRKPFASFIELPWRYVIGGSSGGRWLDSEEAGKRLTAPMTPYRIFTLKGETGRVTGAKASPEADVCPDVWMHQITPEPNAQDKSAIGVNASWNPMPRQPSAESDIAPEVFEKAMSALLISRGVSKPQVKITQLLRVDLDGDGKLETLMTARHFNDEIERLSVKAGDYCLVVMRRIVNGQVQTQMLDGNVYSMTDPNLSPSTYEVAGLLDLDGDGKLEVLVRTGYYEGGGMQVWQSRGDKLVKVIEMDCGV